uniref:Synaptonemal complex central element protein 2 n=1 Tax=Ciona savignyi TaxID=51511 RepID=H2ZLR1_CIOSA
MDTSALLTSNSDVHGHSSYHGGDDSGHRGEGDAAPAGYYSEMTEIVLHQVQELMQDLGEKREADHRMLQEFRSRMHNMLEVTCKQIEDRLILQHEETNKEINVKMQFLNDVLERVVNLEGQITDFKNEVAMLYKEFHQ